MEGVELKGSTAEVTKIMKADPRRIARVEIKLNLQGVQTEKEMKILENTAKTCPVLNSLHPDMEKEIVFNWK
jgi:uncharacterized OsmC-like protein